MRIVSLLPSATEILYKIGAGDEVVAVTHECDFPEAATRLPAITSSAFDHSGQTCSAIDRHIKHAVHEGSSLYKLDETLLAKLNPDLIVTQELCEVCAVSYREVGQAVRSIDSSAVVMSLEPSTIEDILETIQTVGERTRHLSKANRVVEDIRSRLEAVAEIAKPIREPRVVCLEWTDPLMVAGHWVPEMVRIAGGHDVLGTANRPSRWIEESELLDASPDFIILMPCGFDLEKTIEIGAQLLSAKAPPEWAAEATIVAVDGSSFFNRPGPRIVEGVELLASIMRHDVEGAGKKARWLRTEFHAQV